jgi:glucose-1-phosphate cytidylyltransferase
MTAIQPPGRYGALDMEGGYIRRFQEKPKGDGGWINGGFFVLNPSVIDYIEGPSTLWEKEPLERLAAESQLCAYKHEGFWQAMDTLRDKMKLEDLWETGNAPWKLWKD